MVVLCMFYVSCILSNILIFNNIEYNCVGSFQVVIPLSKFFDDNGKAKSYVGSRDRWKSSMARYTLSHFALYINALQSLI